MTRLKRLFKWLFFRSRLRQLYFSGTMVGRSNGLWLAKHSRNGLSAKGKLMEAQHEKHWRWLNRMAEGKRAFGDRKPKDTYGRGKMKYLQWVDGRQGSGYKIMYLWNWVFDLVIIRYPYESFIKPHTDPVDRGRHHRINIELTRPKLGCHFSCDARWIVFKIPRVVWFRPDRGMHSVSKNLDSSCERVVFSIGWTFGRESNDDNWSI